MSFVAGSLAGAIVTGGVYYGFSNLIQTRTAQLGGNLHVLSERMINASTIVPSPPPASARITHRPFVSLLQSRWNEEIANVFAAAGRWEQTASDWVRRMLHGEHM